MQGCLDQAGLWAWLWGTVLIMLFEVGTAPRGHCPMDFVSLTAHRWEDGRGTHQHAGAHSLPTLNYGGGQLLRVPAAPATDNNDYNPDP